MSIKHQLFYKSPLQGFIFYRQDEAPADYNYYMFQNLYGDYVIQREDKTSGTMLYTRGVESAMNAAWVARVTQVYGTPKEAFNFLRD